MTRRSSESTEGVRRLIDSKLEPPESLVKLVARPQLIEMLDRCRDGRITLGSAPAGYGKTTLVLDDYGIIRTQAIHEFVEALVSRLLWNGDLDRAREHASRVLDRGGNLPGHLRPLLIMCYAVSPALTGRWAEYLRFVEGGTMGSGAAHERQRLPFLVAQAWVHLYRGEMAGCRAVAASLTPGTGFSIPKLYESIGYFFLGAVAYERNQLDEAEGHFLHVSIIQPCQTWAWAQIQGPSIETKELALLIGELPDEAALMGVLDTLYVHGVRLLGVKRVEKDGSTAPGGIDNPARSSRAG